MELILDLSFLVLSIVGFILLWSAYSDTKKKWVSNVPDTRLIKETILFTGDILYQKGVKHYPTFKISYYKHPKYGGTYCNNKIVIYCKNTVDLEDTVTVTLHEICHHLQKHTNKQYSRYDEFTKAWGHCHNPFELEARNFAHEWLEPCLTHLAAKGIIVKK